MDIQKKTYIKYIILATLTLQSCSGHYAVKSGHVYSHKNEPENLDNIKAKLVNYYGSDYEKQVSEMLEVAKEKTLNYKKVAIIFDVAETLLSNWQYEIKYQLGFHYPSWKRWVDKAKAESVPGIKFFYDYCLKSGFDIYIMTGRRREKENINNEPTIINLRKLGFVKYKKVFFMEERFKKDRGLFKKTIGRNIINSNNYDIIINIGDQERDFWQHKNLVNIKIPNPFYRAPSEIVF